MNLFDILKARAGVPVHDPMAVLFARSLSPQPSVQHFGMKWAKNNPDPAARCTYFGDCAGFTPAHYVQDEGISLGSWEDAFFITNNYPAMIKPDGTMDYRLDPADFTKKLDGTASNVGNHATDNAMSVFDCHIWIKMYEDTDYQYIEVANEQLDEGYVDFPYLRADGTHRDKLYYPMFEGIISGNKLRSLAVGNYPSTRTSLTAFVGYAQNNDLNIRIGETSIWNVGDWSHYLWITLLMMLLGKTTKPSSVFGYGAVGSNSGLLTIGSSGLSGQFIGSPSTGAIKTFYCENLYGNMWKRIIGFSVVDGVAHVKNSPPYYVDGTYTGYTNCGEMASGLGWMKDLKLTSCGYIPSNLGGSASTYTGGCVDIPSGGYMLAYGGWTGAAIYYGAGVDGGWTMSVVDPSGTTWNSGAALYLYN